LASHPTEYRLDDIQKLRLRGQGQYLDKWCFVVLGPTIEKFDAVEELLGRMPRRRIPREVNTAICLVLASQLVDQFASLCGILAIRVEMDNLVSRQFKCGRYD
jgi:hypothetical protein